MVLSCNTKEPRIWRSKEVIRGTPSINEGPQNGMCYMTILLLHNIPHSSEVWGPSCYIWGPFITYGMVLSYNTREPRIRTSKGVTPGRV